MKLKPIKSAYAGGMPPCPVKLEGSTPLNQIQRQGEYNGLLITLAAILEENNGSVTVTQETINTIKRSTRTLQLAVNKETGDLTLQFKTASAVEPEPVEKENFLTSSVAQEAREYLAKQKEQHDNS